MLEHLQSDGKVSLPDRFLFWDLFGKQAALHGDWKLVGEIPNHHGDFAKARKDAKARQFELYNLKHDLAEAHDVSSQHPHVAGDLKKRLPTWLEASAP